MKQLLGRVSKNKIVRGSAILLLAGISANVLNYAFHMVIGRMLGPAEYGVIGSLVAIMTVLSVFGSSIQIVNAKWAAMFKAKHDERGIHNLFMKMTKKIMWIGLASFFLVFTLSPAISYFLNIPNYIPVAVFSFVFLIVFLLPIVNGIMQGMQKFFYLSLSNIVITLSKLVFGVLLVILGLGASGAIAGNVISIVIGYVLGLWLIKKVVLLKNSKTRIEWHKIKEYGWPVFFSYLGTTLIITVDVVLVKHFFPPYEAGLYAALSLMGMIIFYIVSPINTVLFPLTAEKYHRNENHGRTFKQALALYSLMGVIMIAAYYMLPQLIIRIIYGQQYLAIAPYMGIYAVYMVLYNLSYIFIVYFLSIHKIRIAWLPIVISILLSLSIVLFHQTFWQVIYALIISNSILLCLLVFYYIFNRYKEKKISHNKLKEGAI